MLLERYKQFAADEELDLRGRILLGISGGVDSVVLADLAHRTAAEVVCLHVNYGLRGRESDEDEESVRDFCLNRGLELVVVDGSQEMQSARGGSVQALARSLRYREFIREASHRGINTVLLAHHADDQVETVLMSLFRGAGINGLAGMPVSRPAGEGPIRVVRPLLFARRSEIEEYAVAHALRWREDSSNVESKYRRSVLRHRIIPLIEENFGPGTSENILRSSVLARRMLRASQTASYLTAKDDYGGRALSVAELEKLPDVVRTRRILDTLARCLPEAPRSMAVAEQIDALLSMQPGRRVQFENAAVIRERNVLLFVVGEDSAPQVQPFSATLAVGSSVRVPGGLVYAQRLARTPDDLDPGTSNIAFLDADLLGEELVVSPWDAGDRISLLGSPGTKKVSDLLTDEKVPVSSRKGVMVVRSSGEVAWVVGVRLCANFAVNASTAGVTMVGFIPDRLDDRF